MMSQDSSKSAATAIPGRGCGAYPSSSAAALMLGAMLLASVVLLLFLVLWARGASTEAAAAMTLPGSALRVIEGVAASAGEALEIRRSGASERVVLASDRLRIEADAFDYLQWTAYGLRPGVDAVFFWRRAADGSQP